MTVTDDDDWMAAFDALPVEPIPPREEQETLDELRRRRQAEGREWRDRSRPGEPETNDAFKALELPEWDQGPDEPRFLNIRWTSTYATDPPPLEDPVIEGLLNAGEFMVVGAERGIGKTWLGYNIASLLATGDGPLFGRLPIPKKRNVLYLQGELDETQAAVRWKILHGNGLDFDDAQLPQVAETFDPVRFRVVRRRRTYKGDGEAFSDEYLDATIDEQLEATIDALGIEVVVVDPWAVFLQGNENSNDEVEAVLSKLREIGMRNNVAFIIFHHLGKARDYAEPEDMWRGASRLADWAANRVTIVRHYTDKKATDLGTNAVTHAGTPTSSSSGAAPRSTTSASTSTPTAGGANGPQNGRTASATPTTRCSSTHSTSTASSGPPRTPATRPGCRRTPPRSTSASCSTWASSGVRSGGPGPTSGTPSTPTRRGCDRAPRKPPLRGARCLRGRIRASTGM